MGSVLAVAVLAPMFAVTPFTFALEGEGVDPSIDEVSCFGRLCGWGSFLGTSILIRLVSHFLTSILFFSIKTG